MSARPVVAAGAAFVLVACATSRTPGAAASSATAVAHDTTARGIVRVVGALPSTVVVLRAADGAQLVLRGSLERELATLDGADVTVHGPVGAAIAPLGQTSRSVTVQVYEIEQIAGGKPVVGMLVRDGAGVRVDSVSLTTLPPALEPFVGSKVWVIGERTSAGALRVEAFGVLRPGPTANDASRPRPTSP